MPAGLMAPVPVMTTRRCGRWVARLDAAALSCAARVLVLTLVLMGVLLYSAMPPSTAIACPVM